MKTLIDNEGDLALKTIAFVKSRFEDVALHFTDWTVAVWHAGLQYGDEIYMTLMPNELDDYTLLTLGVMSQSEYDKRQAAKKAEGRSELPKSLLLKYGANQPV